MNKKQKQQMQKTFNKVVRHLLKQKKRSAREGGRLCLYRGPNGMKCAIGCLIPNKEYKEKMDYGYDVMKLWTSYPKLSVFKPVKHREHEYLKFLCMCQDIHDFNYPRQWKKELLALANKYELTFPTIKPR